jgi:hypothetical protein
VDPKAKVDITAERAHKTTTMEDVQVKKNQISFKITRCFWAELFRNMNATDLDEMLVCETDFPRARV